MSVLNRNFSGTLKEDRIQNLKAVMIYGSASAVDAMKSAGMDITIFVMHICLSFVTRG